MLLFFLEWLFLAHRRIVVSIPTRGWKDRIIFLKRYSKCWLSQLFTDTLYKLLSPETDRRKKNKKRKEKKRKKKILPRWTRGALLNHPIFPDSAPKVKGWGSTRGGWCRRLCILYPFYFGTYHYTMRWANLAEWYTCRLYVFSTSTEYQFTRAWSGGPPRTPRSSHHPKQARFFQMAAHILHWPAEIVQ